MDAQDSHLSQLSKRIRSDDVFNFRQSDIRLWPRRLLYVPEMQSYPRQEGDKYREDNQPRYNIITYTWGRWQRPFGEGEAIHVNGISWHIPAVDPSIFSAESFESILKRVAQGVDWVWVDVACIDQEDPIEGADEIGRQAGIFAGADELFVWLHHSPISRLQQFVDLLFDIADRAETLYEDMVEFAYVSDSEASSTGSTFTPHLVLDEEWRDQVMESLNILDRDPWFSSLWTLQEAFLRSDATLLSKEGMGPIRKGYVGVFYSHLLIAWNQINDTIKRSLKDFPDEISPEIGESLGTMIKHMERLGLDARTNPVALYSAAGHRTATRENDRIYGIMQVLGLRLGKSAIPEKEYSLAELEIQFATALNAKSPIWAQLFIHTSPQPPGRHWCISQTSQAPECLSFSRIFPRSECAIDLNPDGNPTFTGKECSFVEMGTAWKEGRRQRPRPKNSFWGSITRSGEYPLELIALDLGHFTERYIPTDLRQIENELSHANQDLRDLLISNHGESLKLFLLGKVHSLAEELEANELSDEEEQIDYDLQENDAWIGMIVRPVDLAGEISWQRVGLAIWSYLPFLDEDVVGWRNISARLD